MKRFVLTLLTLTLALTVNAADWSRFRGPNGAGVAEGKMPSIDPNKPLWKVEIPGRGASSPIIVAGKLYVQTASTDGKTRTLICLNAATGKTEWTKDVEGSTAHTHKKNTLASSTPACDGESIFCVWWDGSGVSLFAYDLTGKEKWRTSLGGYESQHGPGFSPVIHGGLVFVNVDDDKHAELVAIDIKTGEKKWIHTRKYARACYSSPFIIKRGDKAEELILGTTTAITSYEPASGKINWNFDVKWPTKAPLRVIAPPVYAGGLFVMSSGDGGGSRYMLAVNPESDAPAKVWDITKDSPPYVPCILVKGDLLFWIADKEAGGFACCANAKTGEVLFNARVTTKPPSSSPVMVGDDILIASDTGEIVVFKAAKEFEQVSKVSLGGGEGVFASPAVADGRVYIRGMTHLYCFGAK